MIKKYKGEYPEESKGFKIKTTLKSGWIVFEKEENENGWITMKVIYPDSIENKANYWLNRSIKECRMAKGRDYLLLEEHRPELLNELKNFYGIDF